MNVTLLAFTFTIYRIAINCCLFVYLFAGIGAATYTHSFIAVPHRFHMDKCHSDANHGCATQVDLLGRCTKLLATLSHYSLHYHSRLLSWTNECRKLLLLLLLSFLNSS